MKMFLFFFNFGPLLSGGGSSSSEEQTQKTAGFCRRTGPVISQRHAGADWKPTDRDAESGR